MNKIKKMEGLGPGYKLQSFVFPHATPAIENVVTK